MQRWKILGKRTYSPNFQAAVFRTLKNDILYHSNNKRPASNLPILQKLQVTFTKENSRF